MTTPLFATQPGGKTVESGQTASTTDRTNPYGSLTAQSPLLQHVSPTGQKPTGPRATVLYTKQEPLVPNIEDAEKHKNDKLAACKHVIKSQPITQPQTSIQTFAKKMVSSTHDLYEAEDRQQPFKEWVQKKDPANPCYLPQNFRFKSKLNFTSKEVLGDAEAEALISQMTEAMLKFKKIASELTLTGYKTNATKTP
jgi:hypothetical protein